MTLSSKQAELDLYVNFPLNLVQIIVLQGSKAKNKIEKTPALSKTEVDWIRTAFALYGLLLLCKENRPSTNGVQNSPDNLSIVEHFIEDCCSRSEQSDCYADELYAAYRQYFSYYYRIEPLKRSQLVNTIKLNNQYRYHRLHHTAGDNRWGFTGFTIDKMKMGKYKSAGEDDEVTINKITDYIRTINQKVAAYFE